MLEMIGVNADDPAIHFDYHLRQGLNKNERPLYINKVTCRGSNHYNLQCPNFESEKQ